MLNFERYLKRHARSKNRSVESIFSITIIINTLKHIHKHTFNDVIMTISNSKMFATFANNLNNWLEVFKKLNVASSKIVNRTRNIQKRLSIDYELLVNASSKFKIKHLLLYDFQQINNSKLVIFKHLRRWYYWKVKML